MFLGSSIFLAKIWKTYLLGQDFTASRSHHSRSSLNGIFVTARNSQLPCSSVAVNKKMIYRGKWTRKHANLLGMYDMRHVLLGTS